MLERVWRKGNPPTLLVGMQIGVATMENNMVVPQKTKNRITSKATILQLKINLKNNNKRITIWSSNPTPGHTSKRNSNSCVNSSTIHSSQDTENNLDVRWQTNR